MYFGIDKTNGSYNELKLKPNSSGQFFKLYRGIVGFSNVLSILSSDLRHLRI